MKQLLFIFLFLVSNQHFIFGQSDTLEAKKLSFSGDFRFRFEQDWNSRKSDGSYSEDRFRLRYRFRFGMNYQLTKGTEFGIRIRSGFREKQQDPNLTLGEGFDEFNSLPIGFDKLFVKVSYKNFMGWIGKNTFPFEKENELFWSDNVYPDGIFGSVKFNDISSFLESLKINAGYFILVSSGFGFDQNQYFQGFQILTSHWNGRIKIFPSFYYFKKMPAIPDGHISYELNYAILHIGSQMEVYKKPTIMVGLDYYQNLEDLKKNNLVPEKLNDQKKGLVVSIRIGKLFKRGDWSFGTYYTYLERYSIIDYLAQNDWTRWDYSSQGSPDGRLSNFKGIEFRVGYLIRNNFKLIIRYFNVEQLVAYGNTKETGDRIRLDLNIGF